MVGLGLGLGARQRGGGGGGGLARLALHCRSVWLGDSITSLSSTKAERNFTEMALFYLNGRVRRAVSGDQGVGGDTMTQIAARLSWTTGQAPDLVVCHFGHNGGLASVGLSTFMTQWTGIYTSLRAALPNARIVMCQTLPSTVAGQTRTDYAAPGGVWEQQAALEGADGGKTRVVLVPSGYNATSGVHTADGVHPLETGAALFGAAVAAVIDTLVETASVDAIMAEVTANSVAGLGVNVDVDWALSGTAGTKSGTVAPTGNVATGKNVTNNTSAAVACDIVAASGFNKQRLLVSGAVSAENTVVFQDTGNISIPSTEPGGFYEMLGCVESTATGLWHFGCILGSIGGFMATISDTSTLAALPSFSGILRSFPKALQSVSASVRPEFRFRYEAGTAGGEILVSRPILRQIELTAYAAPFRCDGDGRIAPANTAAVNGTGTVGQTLTAQPGTWSGGGIAFTFQWTRNGVDIAGATSRTYVLQAADSGTTVSCRVTATNTVANDNVVPTGKAVA